MNNWLLRPFFYWFASVSLFLMGWKAKGKTPDLNKFVLIAAPHSSNWDFVFFLLIIFKLKIPVHWMAKHTMFKWPFKRLLKRLGGIPVDRSSGKGNIVQSITDAFEKSKNLIITIAPSGTREKVARWKTGFYHIARQAKVPIVCGFIDYQHKIGGIGPVFNPSGDIDADMTAIRSFYAKFSGKYPQPPYS
ncbi:MAG: lysophospholipid acyltransferase family protein [Proteobacteria bacterium]|nr:lysophospholipid acyltransferase family protein [Pseudomonadota bacterium]MBU1585105.1 lysophospholipid acyltransferase family protein [Pseudomonadota bacterium]MBU2452058.1 lysophospholipid acyltransferase family protein [Pseudomonadota bacterium]MBU2630648.1 lysophospholipid acyltransferase family protein [Pseudomonadota bacterium]